MAQSSLPAFPLRVVDGFQPSVRRRFGIRLPYDLSVIPYGAILRAVDVLFANFDGVFLLLYLTVVESGA